VVYPAMVVRADSRAAVALAPEAMVGMVVKLTAEEKVVVAPSSMGETVLTQVPGRSLDSGKGRDKSGSSPIGVSFRFPVT